MTIINTREDLDHHKGTLIYDQFMAYLRGTMTHRVNTAVYPDGYDGTLSEGAEGYIAPIWVDVEDLTTITKYGFTKEDFV